MKSIQLTGVVTKERGEEYCSLCLELNVASQGRSISEARRMLIEAVSLYLETCIEDVTQFLRPVSPDDNPLITSPDTVVNTFKITAKIGAKTSVKASSCKATADS